MTAPLQTLATRPLRSLLYIPASNPRAMSKAESLACDGVILDLEDAVAPAAKDAARAAAVAASGRYGNRLVLIRANPLETAWGAADVRAIAQSAAHGVLVPKVESVEHIKAVEALLHHAPPTMEIWAMIETPRGVLAASLIAGATARGTTGPEATARLAGLVVGTSDLVKDLHGRHTPHRAPLHTALSLVVLAARANHLAVIDGVHLDLDDDAGFMAACQQGRDWGFDGKSLIHPKTIAPANAAFGPTGGEIAYAEKIIAAHAQAMAESQAVVVVDGQLIESLHVAEATRLLAMAHSIAGYNISGAKR